MMSPALALSSQTRREVLASFLPHYRTASSAEKSLLLDTFVKMTGYARKSAIRVLNHPPACTGPIRRSRLPVYGPEVLQALCVAWKATRYVCAQRLVPFLPTLVGFLERQGYLRLSEESRTRLLSISATTAQRFLRTQRKPVVRGLSVTTAGPLLKAQIPIRTFEQWDETRPGFLEADLVAHCAGRVEGSYLYTLTLTDIATGWTECLPLLFRSPEAVLAALTRARALFPFPILGIDADNGKEFINEAILAYCEREQLTFTRGRPEVKNDQCFVEQKNGAIVRSFIGYDRLSGEPAYRQLRELYGALRLYINCFQPSMKLLSKEDNGDHVRRVYDPAKTPLQRLLLSGVLPEQEQQHLQEVTQNLDPFRLLDHLEQLQQALWYSVGSTAVTGLLRFSASRCVAGPQPASASKGAEPATEVVSLFPPSCEEGDVCQDFLDWAPTTRDPFEGIWQHILSLVLTHPAWSSGEVFQEVQRQFPGCYRLAHLGTLQRRLRQIRVHLLDLMEEPWSDPLIQRDVPNIGLPQQEQHVPEAKLPDGPVETPSRLPLLSNEEVERRTPASTGSPGERQIMEQLLPTLRAQSIEGLIQSYLQELVTNGRLPKTLEWHQTALRQFQQYLMKERSLFLLTQVRQTDIDGWIANLHATPTARGSVLAASSMATYGRSVRAFWHWALREGHVQHLPFAPSTFPRGEKKRLMLLDAEAFDRLLLACGPCGENSEPQEWATARNRAILWVLLDTGLRVSELCELRLFDVDRASGMLHIRGQGARERQLLLSSPGQDQVRCYLEQYRCKNGSVAGGRAREEYLFLTETYQPFTKNALTLLFARLKTRAGLSDVSICPSLLHDTFAVRYLQAGGTVEDLGTQLGLRDLATLKRYVCAARLSSEAKPLKKPAELPGSVAGQILRQRKRHRKRASPMAKSTQ